MSEPASTSGPQQPGTSTRRVKVHKIRHGKGLPPMGPEEQEAFHSSMDQRIAQLIPSMADLSVATPEVQLGAQQVAREIRQQRLQQDQAELHELRDIYDMGTPNPVDSQLPAGPWVQKIRPRPRKIVLSPYQYEMINYQRMHLRNNIWYYRDRMSVPRGPCPLHVLKDAWVQGAIDENTLMWGHGLFDWLPAKNIKLLLPMIRTPEVRFGSWVKRTFSLKPALERIRERRQEFRNPDLQTQQVERMR